MTSINLQHCTIRFINLIRKLVTNQAPIEIESPTYVTFDKSMSTAQIPEFKSSVYILGGVQTKTRAVVIPVNQ